ncbi:MAG: histidinol-phosphatase [Lachnospiraceae bacterium]|nr:histidinol-phosphatase [Lachnospiraceae bacterium]
MRDLHVHTIYSDGENLPEEIVLMAIKKGMSEIGISDHSYTWFDESYCIRKDKIEEYKTEIARLREKYKDQIRVLCGVEQDYYSDEPTDDYDYVIGSVHYLMVDGAIAFVDESPELFRQAIDVYFGGDVYAFAEKYYETVADVVNKTGCDIIGHFDLFSKFNEDVRTGKKNIFFDPSHPRYVAAWKKAVDALIPTGKLFEINTGGMASGRKTDPYPSEEIQNDIRLNGGAFIYSSDAHRAENLCFRFEA